MIKRTMIGCTASVMQDSYKQLTNPCLHVCQRRTTHSGFAACKKSTYSSTRQLEDCRKVELSRSPEPQGLFTFSSFLVTNILRKSECDNG